MKIGQCKLCLQVKLLCNESHIYPKFLYKYLTGQNGKLILINDVTARFRYNSEYEGNILCENCDNQILGKLDDYAAKLIYGESSLKINSYFETSKECRYLVIENDPNYRYKEYRLFLLSLLWRVSISSRPFFSSVKLSLVLEEELRRMVLLSEPGEPTKYPSFLFLPPHYSDGENVGFNTFDMSSTFSPELVKNDGWEICKMFIAGMTFIFIVDAPKGARFLPSVQKSKLMFRISTQEEHNNVHKSVIRMIVGHNLNSKFNT